MNYYFKLLFVKFKKIFFNLFQTRYKTHVKQGFLQTFRAFLKAEFETPFPKPIHQKRKYDSQIEQLKMNYMIGNKITGDSFRMNLNAVNLGNNMNEANKMKNFELFFEDKKSKPDYDSFVNKRKMIRSVSSDNPIKSNESLNKNNDNYNNVNNKSPKKFYYLSQSMNKSDEPDIQYDFVTKKRVALV